MSARSHSRARARDKRKTAQAAHTRARKAMMLDPSEGITHTAESAERAVQDLVRRGVLGWHVLEAGTGKRAER